ncbi:galactocerebrosidase-like [Dreissena polymorpha]|nr:galactocerebrosidase-like [Dreissena polymorpha]
MLGLLICLVAFAQSPRAGAEIYTVDDGYCLGRLFDGIGAISGGGATSKLLVNYPDTQRREILDYLFKPNFGSSLQILKVEIGGDGQSTDGTESSHMHSPEDENYRRGYEWWLMVEAKKRNPAIKIYALSWAFPGWLNKEGQRNPYTYANVTAGYVIKWIQGAHTHYGISVDYVGIWNEKVYDRNYVITLRRELDRAGLHHVLVVAPDAPLINDWKICPDILKDPELAKAVNIVGCHYPGTLTTTAAIETGKPLWASEDYSTFNDLSGGGCWARILNQNYVNGNITATIAWNLIASYYDTLPYTREGLMTAETPWSGHYVVESPIWMTAHTTQFTEIGWSYLRHRYGSGHLAGGGSYVSLTSPDRNQLTIVLETMSHDHSQCIRPPLPEYNVTKQDVFMQLKGNFANISSLQVWRSALKFGDASSEFFQNHGEIKVVDGRVKLQLNVDELVTLTTVTTGNKGSHPDPPPDTEFPLPYKEDFENYVEDMEPYNFAQQTGVFEVHSDGNHGNMMRQMVLQIPIYWCSAEKLNLAITMIGSETWSDIAIIVDARLPSNTSAAEGYFLAARVNQGGCWVYQSRGVFIFVDPVREMFAVYGSIDKTVFLAEGSTGTMTSHGWNTLSLSLKSTWANGSVNGRMLFNVTVPEETSNGFVGLGTTSWGYADFDNIYIDNPGSHL